MRGERRTRPPPPPWPVVDQNLNYVTLTSYIAYVIFLFFAQLSVLYSVLCLLFYCYCHIY